MNSWNKFILQDACMWRNDIFTQVKGTVILVTDTLNSKLIKTRHLAKLPKGASSVRKQNSPRVQVPEGNKTFCSVLMTCPCFLFHFIGYV